MFLCTPCEDWILHFKDNYMSFKSLSKTIKKGRKKEREDQLRTVAFFFEMYVFHAPPPFPGVPLVTVAFFMSDQPQSYFYVLGY